MGFNEELFKKSKKIELKVYKLFEKEFKNLDLNNAQVAEIGFYIHAALVAHFANFMEHLLENSDMPKVDNERPAINIIDEIANIAKEYVPKRPILVS